MYLVAFAAVYYLAKYRIRTEKLNISLESMKEFMPWGILGLLLGARLGDVLIYDWAYFKNHLSQIFLPFDIFNHWQYVGIFGMSYFGGLIGLAIAFYFFTKLKLSLSGSLRLSFSKMLEFSDLFAPAAPLAFAFGRLGNFINAVIDEKSFDKLAAYIEEAKKNKNVEIIAGGKYYKSKGYFIEPTSAATIAGLKKYGKHIKKEVIVTTLTGTGLKATEKIGHL